MMDFMMKVLKSLVVVMQMKMMRLMTEKMIMMEQVQDWEEKAVMVMDMIQGPVQNDDQKMMIRDVILFVVAAKNIYLIQLFILILEQNMMVILQWEQIWANF